MQRTSGKHVNIEFERIRCRTNTDVMKPNREPKLSVVELLVGLLFWEIVL
jgi:hypothetical protein